MLFEITKLRIWKQFTTNLCFFSSYGLLFEITKLRIWKQFTTSFAIESTTKELFEITKLRIWKQFTTMLLEGFYNFGCLRSQSYEFESNSQQYAPIKQKGSVVWGHKVTNLKAIHNYRGHKNRCNRVVWDHKITNLKAIHNCVTVDEQHYRVVWDHKVTNLKAIHNAVAFHLNNRAVV